MNYAPGDLQADIEPLTQQLRVEHQKIVRAFVERPATKKLTGTTSNVQGGSVSVAHGLTLSKILSLSALVTSGTVRITPEFTFPVGAYQYSVLCDATNVTIYNSAANSANILSSAFSVLVVYEE